MPLNVDHQVEAEGLQANGTRKRKTFYNLKLKLMKLNSLSKILAMSKFFFYMALLQSFFATLALAETSKAQSLENTYVSGHWSDLNLEKAFLNIQQQSDFFFTYDYQLIQKISISKGSAKIPLLDLLKYISNQTGLKFSIFQNTVYVLKGEELRQTNAEPLKINVPAVDILQVLNGRTDYRVIYEVSTLDLPIERILSGTIRSAEEGEPLIGATILVKETGQGTTADEKGAFRLSIPDAGKMTLVVSYIGYQTAEINVNGESMIEIVLKESSTDLNEVVVVGYGTQKKINLTGAVTVIDNKQIQNRPITQASQALYGISPGVIVNSNSGEAGNDDVTIRIRGVGTLNDANPLILVDGIEAPLNNISPDDIQSINILKDAASAAIYGSRAANGVVLITTKRGDFEKKSAVDYTFYAGVANPTILPKIVADPRTYLELYREAARNSARNFNFTDADIQRYDNIPGTDWVDVVFRENVPISQHNLSLSGGSSSVAYRLSLGYLDQEGIIGGDQRFKRYNARLNIDGKLSKRLRAGASLSYTHDNANLATKERLNNLSGKGYLAFESAISQHPINPVFDSLGRYAVLEQALGVVTNRNNAQSLFDNVKQASFSNDFLGNAYVEFEILKGLSIRGTVAANYQNEQVTETAKEHNYYDWVTGRLAVINYLGNRISEFRNSSLNVTSWLQTTYDVNFGKHNLKFLAGVNQESATINNLRVDQTAFGSSSLIKLGDGTNTTVATTSPGEWALQSFFGRISYDFAGKYLLEANLRRDGSSRFGDNNRWATFPSFSAGYIVSNENFWGNLSEVINLFKIRTSWGKLGNQNTSLYPYASAFSLQRGYVFNDVALAGGALTRLGNPDLKWEETTLSNLGVNIEFLNSRIGIEADVFLRETDNILTPIANPLVMGTPSATIVNAGSVENKGWEATLRYRDKIGNFNFELGGNISNIKNKVTAINPALAAGEDRATSTLLGVEPFNQVFIIRGQPIGALYGYVHEGIFQSQAEIDAAPNHSLIGKPAPGDMRYKDINGDNKITPEDQTVIGNTQPEWIYGFNFGANYKGIIDVAAIFQGIGQADQFVARLVGPFPFAGLREIWTDRWTPENPSPDRPRLWIDRSGFNGQSVQNNPTSFWVENRAYLRLKNVQVGFNLPNKWLKKMKLQKGRIFLNGQNLWTLTDFADGDFDPERLPVERHVTTSLPHSKIYTAGVNVTF